MYWWMAGPGHVSICREQMADGRPVNGIYILVLVTWVRDDALGKVGRLAGCQEVEKTRPKKYRRRTGKMLEKLEKLEKLERL